MRTSNRAGSLSARYEAVARRAAWLAVLVLALTLGFGSAAFAQFNFFEQLFQPPRAYYPPQGQRYERYDRYQRYPRYEGERRPRLPRAVTRAARPVEKKPEAPAVPPSFFVAVLGDSLGQMLGQGLTDAFADRPEVAILRKARENSGLVRSDFYDWVKASQDLLASGEKINVAVILVGSNDRQSLRDGTASYEPNSPKWNELYAARIEAIANQFHEKKIPLIWVGLPIMKSERMSDEALTLNELFKEHASKAGATYIDIWEAFGDDHGAFASTGPDVEGQVVRLRAADGIHFTKAGARKLAHFVEDEIKKVLDAAEPGQDTDLAKTVPGQQEGAPGAVKPPIGPVLSLTGAPTSPDGGLVNRVSIGNLPRPPQGDDAASQATPKPGRADDFSWPQP